MALFMLLRQNWKIQPLIQPNNKNKPPHLCSTPWWNLPTLQEYFLKGQDINRNPLFPKLSIFAKHKLFKTYYKWWVLQFNLNFRELNNSLLWVSHKYYGITSPMSPCTTRIGSIRISRANFSIFLRNVALNKRAGRETGLKCLEVETSFQNCKNTAQML